MFYRTVIGILWAVSLLFAVLDHYDSATYLILVAILVSNLDEDEDS